jgi:hypothetical protein
MPRPGRFPRQCLGNLGWRERPIESPHRLEIVGGKPPPELLRQIGGQCLEQFGAIFGSLLAALLELNDAAASRLLRSLTRPE